MSDRYFAVDTGKLAHQYGNRTSTNPSVCHVSRDPWRQYGYRLDSYEGSLKHLTYSGALKPQEQSDAFGFFSVRTDPSALSLAEASGILSEQSLGPPHGYALLNPVPIPEFPQAPERPKTVPGQYELYIVERASKAEAKAQQLFEQFLDQYKREATQLAQLKQACEQGDDAALRLLMSISHVRHHLHPLLMLAFDVEIDQPSRVILTTVRVPDFKQLPIVKPKGSKSWNSDWTLVSAAERKRATETLLYALCLRAAYLVAMSDEGAWFDTVAINIAQSWFDSATGAPQEGIIASLQASKADLVALQLHKVDPKACFRHLKGISTPSVESVAPVRPIFVMSKEDDRIVENKDVAETLEAETNLAAMPWEDFEHLVSQLFEWEFGKNGVEVKVTRASRDRGVDAIMFDPDPLRGGKYVLQAKRYTRPVDVAAVRDLYGTVMNEGANRGIIVTTSTYGPDAYEFAKDKPLSLVDGQHLIAMLRKHGRNFRINLAEARKAMEAEARSAS
ncbi:restriction endonuclease [Bradyrhizobium oropedii]|uniref:restriction endonuclease n=1 Tax=Bradyrhizobium oropedii TaxID=1571201 RepID=UPI001E3E4AA6|nr:restriction endonuclease [Bradyrhizobium oropedii]